MRLCLPENACPVFEGHTSRRPPQIRNVRTGDLSCHPALVRVLADVISCMNECELRDVEARTLISSGVDLLEHTWPCWFTLFVKYASDTLSGAWNPARRKAAAPMKHSLTLLWIRS
jgi:hypothetical protein